MTIVIKDCSVHNCGGGIHLEGGIDGIDVDGFHVTNTPIAISSTGPIRNGRFRRIVHHPDLSKKIGRNDPCWCGSGEKFKKCCLP